MISKGNAPTARQKRWWNWLAEQGCCACRVEYAEIHHIKGASHKIKGVGKIGNWYVLPLCYWDHRDPANQKNVDLWKKRFEARYGTQLELFDRAVDRYMDAHNGEMPFTSEIYKAIMGDVV